ncbi:MAG: DUF5606 domain-containing protein [Bacteroidales bacterium]|jgi:hypothetical protein|nr:DUF5606 domain-containing protein [Bacteroidales bacterium]MDD4702829.1 DUF5606 domain-containing protein [Bacteroidales bacterium]MDX9798168.1 DUF5606 domain-containing protein [Bacteroidales bacterium]
MDLSKILSISGKPGLFTLISQAKNGALIESLVDGKRQTAFANAKISSLQDISIFTIDEDVPLTKVFQNIFRKEDGKECIDPKSDSKKLIEYMNEVVPNFDSERVYVSDMKKLFTWYNLLNSKGLIDLEDKQETDNNTQEEVESKEENTKE